MGQEKPATAVAGVPYFEVFDAITFIIPGVNSPLNPLLKPLQRYGTVGKGLGIPPLMKLWYRGLCVHVGLPFNHKCLALNGNI